MDAKAKILAKVRDVYGKGEGPETVYKGFEFDGDGWQYRPFGRQAIFLGKSLAEALETLDQIKVEREQQAADMARYHG